MDVHQNPQVGVIMGSDSDWPTMKLAVQKLMEFDVPVEYEVVSAHRTPDFMTEYAHTAHIRGLKCIIAGAGGAAHLPGMVAGHTILPVIGVPIMTIALHGLDSLLSIVQMPSGVPVATVAIGKADNAALLAVSILALSNDSLAHKLLDFRQEQTNKVRAIKLQL
ncbi:MAG: 5-(carboxyamino)imidazole ribonucleotide mutase [Candidatus Doudnabacteria bacterium RIFCSPHIGHO2_02_FULL_42_25]|uniref:N5-carboxyaminoimidazole ribonucleotide mutase n=1 Tax=Candidatus Doudnabacteria bacterium RIFCSPHIGHO2_01_FULL_41_86 TaxID=1817821 RepID=A0A1F5N861_9BACT|nr:MAG: 5-(carboxyamino)imidazole ribonucleotide mutase [Candidatus Doudnabacteria bacterium RIFCSPHIGHO2_01_FULL_41_86]OGE75890.1 MAG: 5-(carboxyamino)imidazole ribonucleotide mutase [Candidatus Doudnabacteria bacterium RIFCSPHIGHO2_01_43_10]OGE86264.1 MAG: 5-(carboxyamino)imidazole ribonucleotide mutase [Candidatus Doudnabacteria bacterium RIFCSPHIGHO2_12_FULL_42_22]OGE87112.1 MAG: 5-(carboxyamino)imidazole ribonucleotide mutase [Candidatus Doudnabacteria bacterium RIFCSPHIGHO2_02_FULL_42_25]